MQSAEVALSKPEIPAKDFLTPFGMMRLKNVAIGRVGEFTDMNGKNIEFTADVMQGIIANFGGTDSHPPRAHTGHPAYYMGEQPSFAEVESLNFDGKYLRADYRAVPFYMAGQLLRDGAYPNRSMELSRSGDSWRLTGVGHLGSSEPGISGMPPIRPSDAEWMDSAEFQFAAPAEDYIFGLRSVQPDTEVSMSEEIIKSSDVSDGGDFVALKAQQEEQIRKLQADHQIALKAAADTAKAEVELKLGAEVAELKLGRAIDEVDKVTSQLRLGSKATAAQFTEGKLEDILLHARLSCPDIKNADGTATTMFSALQTLLEMNVSGPTTRQAGFSREGSGNAPEGFSGDSKADQKAAIAKYQAANPGADTFAALKAIASGRAN